MLREAIVPDDNAGSTTFFGKQEIPNPKDTKLMMAWVDASFRLTLIPSI